MKKTIIALLAALALLLGAGCSTTNKYGDAFRFPLEGEPQQLDPQMAMDVASVTVLRSLMEGLTRLDESGKPIAAAAESWTVDGTVWIFTLRQSNWSNGQAVTAADFVYGWQRAVDAATGSPLVKRFDNIKQVRAESDTRLVVELHTADADLATVVADTAFFPCNKEFFLQTQGRYGMEAEYILCNGPFRITAWEHGGYLIMRRNDGYYAAASIRPDAVRYVIGEVDDRVKALQEGELDACELDAEQAAKVEGKLPLLSVSDSLFALWFNTSVSALSDAAVRAALRDTVEWDLVRQQAAAMGHTTAGTDFIPPAANFNGAAYPAGTAADAVVGQVQTAAATLKKANLPTMTVICSDDPDELQLARLIVQSWQKNADLYFSLQPLPQAELTAHLAVGNYQIAIGEVVGASGDAGQALAAFLSDSSNNVTRLQNAALLQQIQEADTVGKLLACEQQLHTLCSAVPLWYGTRWFATGETVTGVGIRPFGGHPYGAVYEFTQADK